jgi:hypothetical protein
MERTSPAEVFAVGNAFRAALSLSLRRKFDLAPWRNVREMAFDADKYKIIRKQSPQWEEGMAMANASNTTAPTQFIQTKL